ncbi:hypothetical protein Hanom_Chr03g00208551 [Helianthus anomalus]
MNLEGKLMRFLKDKNFEGTSKDSQKEDHKKWFKDSHERKFKRLLKYYQRDRSMVFRKNNILMGSLGDFGDIGDLVKP